MARALLLVLLPIVLPLLLYAGYLKFIKRPVPAGAAGTDARGRARQKTLFWIMLGIVVVAVAAFASLRFSGSVAPGTVLVPPRLIDGKVVPSHPVE